MESRDKENKEVVKKKRGRKAKDEKREYELNKDQSKFFVDLSNNKNELELVFDLLAKTNDKLLGREIIFKDLALFGLSKITNKDIGKIKDMALTEMERVELACNEHNMKLGLNLSLGEFLVKKLGID